MPDAAFDDPRLAALYDPLEADRHDLEVYASVAAEMGASSVLDIGCGTGELACRLVLAGLTVTGVDPAAASLDVARRKLGRRPGQLDPRRCDLAPPLSVDLAFMTGNVAAGVPDRRRLGCDASWRVTCAAAGWPPGVRDPRPCERGLDRWTRERSFRQVEVEGIGAVETWVDLTGRDGALVSFRWTFRFLATGEVLVSDSTLRFRTRDELDASLTSAGFDLVEVREAPIGRVPSGCSWRCGRSERTDRRRELRHTPLVG